MKEKNLEIKKAKSPKQIREATKLTTSKLAVKFGLKTNELNRKFVEMGYLEKKSKNFYLTKKVSLQERFGSQMEPVVIYCGKKTPCNFENTL